MADLGRDLPESKTRKLNTVRIHVRDPTSWIANRELRRVFRQARTRREWVEGIADDEGRRRGSCASQLVDDPVHQNRERDLQRKIGFGQLKRQVDRGPTISARTNQKRRAIRSDEDLTALGAQGVLIEGLRFGDDNV